MLDVPSHLSQPLHVDTNIVYDMDLELFPGLDDPTRMYEPALFIATDWSQYIHDPKVPVIQAEPDVDLFELLESTQPLIPDLSSVSEIDADTFQALIDDVITDNVTSGDIMDLLDSGLSVNIPNATNCDINVQSLDTDCDCTGLGPDFPEAVLVKSPTKKRGRTDDGLLRELKRSKIDSLDLPHCVTVCSQSKRSLINRGS